MGGQSCAAVRGSLHAELPQRDPAAARDFGGAGGEQLRAGTMFLASLYFALPLLGESRLPLAFLTAESFQGVHGSPLKIKERERRV